MSQSFDQPIEGYKSRIINHRQYFSKAECRIADYLTTNNLENYALSIYDLARETHTSAATVIRFCRTIGFKGYAELRFYIQRGYAHPLEGNLPAAKTDTPSVLKQKVSAFNKKAIDDTVMMIDDQALEQAIMAISSAGRFEIFAEGGSGGIAISAANTFSNIGVQCHAHTDAYEQMMTASYLVKGDVVIGLCHRGDIVNTIDAIQAAHERGATTITIIGYVGSPIVKHSDIVLYTSSHTLSINDIPSIRICELLVINILQIGVLCRDYDHYTAVAKIVRSATNKKRLIE